MRHSRVDRFYVSPVYNSHCASRPVVADETYCCRFQGSHRHIQLVGKALNAARPEPRTSVFEQIFDIGPPDQTARWQNAYNIVRAQAARDEQNQLRRPVIAEELEQTNLVKPRLVAAQGGAR